jgi:hypothetical protein
MLSAAAVECQTVSRFRRRPPKACHPAAALGANAWIALRLRVLHTHASRAVVVQFGGADIPVCWNCRQTGMSAPPNCTTSSTAADGLHCACEFYTPTLPNHAGLYSVKMDESSGRRSIAAAKSRSPMGIDDGRHGTSQVLVERARLDSYFRVTANEEVLALHAQLSCTSCRCWMQQI